MPTNQRYRASICPRGRALRDSTLWCLQAGGLRQPSETDHVTLIYHTLCSTGTSLLHLQVWTTLSY